MSSSFPSHQSKPQLGYDFDPHQRHNKDKWDQPLASQPIDSKDEQRNIVSGSSTSHDAGSSMGPAFHSGDDLKLQSSGSIQDQDKGKLQGDTRATSISAQTSMNDPRRHTSYQSSSKEDRMHIQDQLKAGGQMGQQIQKELQAGASQNLLSALPQGAAQQGRAHDSLDARRVSAAESSILSRQEQERAELASQIRRTAAAEADIPVEQMAQGGLSVLQQQSEHKQRQRQDPTEPVPLADPDLAGTRGADLAMADIGGMSVGDVERMRSTHTGSAAGKALGAGGPQAYREQGGRDVSGPSGKDTFGMQQGAERLSQ